MWVLPPGMRPNWQRPRLLQQQGCDSDGLELGTCNYRQGKQHVTCAD